MVDINNMPKSQLDFHLKRMKKKSQSNPKECSLNNTSKGIDKLSSPDGNMLLDKSISKDSVMFGDMKSKSGRDTLIHYMADCSYVTPCNLECQEDSFTWSSKWSLVSCPECKKHQKED